jgi:hypothetical protein
MPLRLAAAFIFAAFGALTVLAMTLVINRSIYMDAGFLPISGFAAFSAALVATWLSPRYRQRPIALGIITMLLAQIPFSFITTGFLLLGRDLVSIRDVMQSFVLLLFFGWLIAGVFQIATGALAGLVMRRWLRHNPPQANIEDVFR